MLCGELKMCFLLFFFSLNNGLKKLLWPLFDKAPLSGVYGLKWSYGQILSSLLWIFAALPLVSLVPLLKLLLKPSL